MKQVFTLFFLFVFGSVFAQTPEQKQLSLLSKVTATWCINCGTWGWTFMEDIVDDNEDKALILGVHFSGDLQNAAGTAFENNFNTFGQPRFFLNDTDQAVNSSNASTKRTAIKNEVDANFAMNPIVNTGLSAIITDDMVDVSVNTEFFQDGPGNYYLGIYVVENEVPNTQTGQSGTVNHPYVLRSAVTNDPFGDFLDDGSDDNFVAMGTTFSDNFSFQMNGSWNSDNVLVASIIWKEDNGKYLFVNANSTTLELPSGLTAPQQLAGADIRIFTAGTAASQVMLTLEQDIEEGRLFVADVLGREITPLKDGAFDAGQQAFDISVPAPGLYIVSLQTAKGILSKKFVVH